MLEAEEQQRLTTNQLMRDDDERFDIDDIHVPLALVERKKPNLIGDDTQAEQGSRLYEPEYEEKQRFEQEQFLLDILKDGKGKHNGKRIAIIGEPGAGKTTLLRKIAFWVQKNTEILPISISLADLPETNFKQEFLEQYLLDKWLKAALPYISPEMVEVTEALQTELKKMCNQGRVWLLLDGVDEMPVQGEEPLWAISNQLKGWVAQARVVLTCRLNVWEANRNVLADNFEIYRTLEFSYGDRTRPDRVGEFIAKWFNKQPDLGQQLRQALDEPGKERIKDLAKNPLRLALLCSTWNLWRDRGGLPDTKAKLYQGFVEKFYEWKSKEFPTTYSQQDQLNRALGELAKLAIDQTASRFRLKHSLVCEVLGKPDQLLYKLAVTQLSWLNEVGVAAESPDEKVYAFWHTTLEEYFAALAIDDWDYFLPSEHKDRPVKDKDNPKQYKPYRIFEPQWKQVILLWLGRREIEGKQKQEFIDALVNFEDRCIFCYERRAYFLAAAAIAEFQNYSQIDEVVGQIVSLGFGYFNTEEQKWVNIFDAISNAAREALQQTQRPKAIDALVQKLSSPLLDDHTRRQMAESLADIGKGNQNAIDALVQKLSSPLLDDHTRRQMAESLADIGKGNQNAIDALVQKLSSPNLDDSTCRRVVESLGKIGQGNQNAIDALVQKLSSPNFDDSPYREVASSLGKIGQGNQNAIDALVQLLNSPNLDDSPCREVASSLGKIGQGNQNAIDALVQKLSSPNLDDSTCRRVVESLGKIGQGNQNAIDALVQLVISPNLHSSTRGKVASSLGNIDSGNQNTIDALVQLLISPNLDSCTSLQVAESLGKIGQRHQKAIDALVQLLISPNLNDSIHIQVALSLGKIGQGNQNTIDALVQLLNSPNLDDSTRKRVASSLEKIGQGNQNAIDALVQLLISPNLKHYIRRQVAESLGKIDSGNQKAIDALVQLLNSSNLDDSTRRRVVESLGKIGQGNQKAIDALVQLLNSSNLDDSTRRRVVERLGNIGQGNQNAIDALVQLLTSPNLDDYTRKEVPSSLGQIGQGNQNAIDALVQLLNSPNLDDYTRRKVASSLGNTGQGNQNAIDALVQLLNSPNLDDYTREEVPSILGKIGQGNQNAIDALVQLLNSPNLDDSTRKRVASSLGKIGQGNQNAINALVQLVISPNLDDYTRKEVAESLKKIDIDKQFGVITALTANFKNPQKIDRNCYELIWHYAQNMPYPDFYQAWHQDTLPDSATASLNLANLPQILAEAINNQPDLCSKIKLICIDTHQFIDPENPAPEIYDEMLNQNCPEWQNGYPDTMQKLKIYWNSLRRQSEISLFFICYDSTALSATPTGFRDSFLKALSKFDGAICVVLEQGDIPLPTFSPSQPDLVAAVVAWIRRSILENRHPI